MNERLNYLRHRLMIYVDGNLFQYTISEPTVRIGRGDENDIQILHSAVSNQHLELRLRTDGAYQLIDVGSRNGTFIDGRYVDQCQLRSGDIILISNVVEVHYRAISQPSCEAGDIDSLALVKRRSPSFESLCERSASREEDQVILPS